MSNYPNSRQSNLVVQEIESELLIYDLQINKAFCLNKTSALVWQFCDGTNSIAEIGELMSRNLKLNVSEEFVWLALDDLKKNGLLEKSETFEINFSGLNRRQIVKKVGLASLIMLPIVTSVIAPTAAQAQSGGCPSNRFCNSLPGTPPSACCPSGICCGFLGTICCFPGQLCVMIPNQLITVCQ
jgi:hypothetical protein